MKNVVRPSTIIEVMNVATAQETSFQPNWAIHPGEMLEEYLETLGVSQAEFARRADLTPKLVNTILKGHNPVESDTALALERVTGIKAYIWMGLQKEWELQLLVGVVGMVTDICMMAKESEF